MNQLKSLIYCTLRGYASRPRRRFQGHQKHDQSINERIPKPRNEKELYPHAKEFDFDPEDCDDDDPDRLESDLMAAGKTYDEHERELYLQKEKLKLRIVARKVFKEEQRNFLTWSERVQIQALHNEDNVEWSVERLSEAYPALPETITKILKSKYKPKTAKNVVKYDENVIANWELFKAGSLPVNPRLEAHLAKFKGRKIVPANLATDAEKFVRPKPYFPPPNSNFFSNLVAGHIEQNKSEIEKPVMLNDGQLTSNEKSNELTVINSSNNVKKDARLHTFDSFLTARIDQIAGNENLSLEDKLLVDEYKQRKSAMVEQTVDGTTQSAVVNKNDESSSSLAKIGPQTIAKIDVPKVDFSKDSLTTGIIEWKKKEAAEEQDYPKFIKIPHKKAETGVTFKVMDRYYDADGEFLYRVPGLKS